MKARKEQAEQKALYLIQLWSDTFMMYEDKFPQFLSAYRLLRKEGVKFPARETSTRFMLSSMGLDSPMFDYLEQVSNSKSPGKPKPTGEAKASPKTQAPDAEAKAADEAERLFRQFTGGNVGVVSREKNQQSLAGVTLGTGDIEAIKSYMQIIDDVCVNAEKLSDMKTEIALEMYQYCQAVHARCLNIIAAKAANGVTHQMDVLLSLSEDLDVRVKLYKNTFVDMVVKERTRGKARPVVPTKEGKGEDKKEEKHEESKKVEKEEEQKAKPRAPIKPLPPPPSNPFFQFETKQDLLEELEEKKAPSAPVPPSPERKDKVDGAASDLLGLNLDFVAGPQSEAKQAAVPQPDKKVDGEIKKENAGQEDDFFESLANRKV